LNYPAIDGILAPPGDRLPWSSRNEIRQGRRLGATEEAAETADQSRAGSDLAAQQGPSYDEPMRTGKVGKYQFYKELFVMANYQELVGSGRGGIRTHEGA
jgi:hypothetical protein